MHLIRTEREAKWDKRFLLLARYVATWSKDNSTKVGTVITRPDHTVASMGFNGFPRGIQDRPELYEDRETKYPRIVHAEANAILCARERLDGYTLYSSPYPPCCECAKLIIQSGIKTVISYRHIPERWKDSMSLTEHMFLEAGMGFLWHDEISHWTDLIP